MAPMLGARHLLGNHNQATVVCNSVRNPQATCKPWMRKRGRYIIGTEKINLQGIMCGTYRRGTLSQSKLADLAGNAVHNACRAVVLLATYCCCAEAEPPTAPEASEVQVAAVAASTD